MDKEIIKEAKHAKPIATKDLNIDIKKEEDAIRGYNKQGLHEIEADERRHKKVLEYVKAQQAAERAMVKQVKLTAGLLEDYLPHGSGIDATWHIEDKGSYFRCDNSYHCMDEYGGYVGWQDFYVIVPKSKIRDFKLHFRGNQYLAQRYMLRGYLEDTISMGLDDLTKK